MLGHVVDTRGWNPQIATILIVKNPIQTDPAILNYISVIRCNCCEIRSQPQENGRMRGDVILNRGSRLLALIYSINYIFYYMNSKIIFFVILYISVFLCCMKA